VAGGIGVVAGGTVAVAEAGEIAGAAAEAEDGTEGTAGIEDRDLVERRKGSENKQ
jgi:hypothetical protein